MRSGIFSLIILGSMLAACVSAQLATISPSPQIIQINIPPFLTPITSALHACAEQHEEYAVILNISSQLEIGDENLSFWLGENSELGSYAIPIAQDELKIILHPENPIDTLSLEQIRAIFSGQVENWSAISDHQGSITIWIYPEGNYLAQIFQAELFPGYQYSPMAHIAPSPESMVTAIANDPGAVGFVLRSWMEDKVTSAQVQSDSNLELQKPLLAITNSEPQGGLRTLMVCLQSGVGQSILQQYYSPRK